MTRTASIIADGPGFTINDLKIREETPNWSPPEASSAYQIVFVRRGLFQLRLSGWNGLVDPVSAYLRGPGVEQQIAHRPGREDACTILEIDQALAQEAAACSSMTGTLRTTDLMDLAHRRMLVHARRGVDAFALSESVVRLVSDVFAHAREIPSLAEPARPSHRQLADSARELLSANPARVRFEALACELGVSRCHLSRVFRRETGESLSSFRARLRVRAALDRIEAGQINLSDLASELGFADHAHLTRTLRSALGMPPSAVRRLLASP